MKKNKILIFTFLAVLLAATLLLAACNTNVSDTTDTSDTDKSDVDTSGENDMTTLEGLGSAQLEDGAIYRIKTSGQSEYEGYSFTVENFGTTDNSLIKLDLYGRHFSQLWRVHKNDDGTYSFENMASLMYLSIKNPDNFKKEKKLSACIEGTNDTAKKWNIYSIDGTADNCVIENTHSSLVATTAVVKATKSVYAQQEKFSGKAEQKWSFEKISDGDGEYPYLLVLSGAFTGSSSCPEIIYHNGVYYNYNMTGPITVKTSTDLRSWTLHPEKYALSARPDWLKSIVSENENGVCSIWAPGAYKIGDKFFLYYCSSSSGSRNSAIGVAVTDDPAKNDWKDLGLVLRSYDKKDKYGKAQTETNFNAIDPNVFIDDDGTPYLVYGSYWDGVFMRKLDANTGMLADPSAAPIHLAKGSSDMEAPYLIKRGDYYYLFVARGGLSKGTYYWAVGRSDNVAGPYVDQDGKTMLSGKGGTRLTEWKDGITGVAHAQPFVDADGTYYMVSESWPYRSDEGNATIQLHISKMVWTEDGWPVTVLGKNVLKELGE